MNKLKTMGDAKRLNRESGYHFFDSDAMAFFDSRIESMLLNGKYFVTSERFDSTHPRLYSIRRINPNGSITTIGEFQAFHSRTEAIAQVFLLDAPAAGSGDVFKTSDGFTLKRRPAGAGSGSEWTDGDLVFADYNGRPIDESGEVIAGEFIAPAAGSGDAAAVALAFYSGRRMADLVSFKEEDLY